MLAPLVRRIIKTAGVAFILALAAGAQQGCGKSASDPAVRVGQVRIETATVEHWERALRRGAPLVASSSAHPRASRHAQAIEFLISGHWLIGEAAKRGLAIPSGAVRRRVEERLGALSNTRKIGRELAAAGRTIADVEFEARVALSASKLREAIFSHTPVATEAELQSYYKRHRDLFRRERRVVDLVEQLKSRSAALALATRLGSGHRFAARATHETVNRPTPREEEHNFNGGLVRAIFAAPLHRIAAPVTYFGKWVIFVVRGVERGPLPFAEVAGKLAERSLEVHRQQALQAFLVRYRREWRAKTICRARFVVPQCAESRENLESEANPLSGA